MTTIKPRVLILGGNFAGLGCAQEIRKYAKDTVDITVIDQKNYLLFIPNIPTEIFEDHDPEQSLKMDLPGTLAKDNVAFIQGKVISLNPDTKQVSFVPSERPGSALQQITYDYLVVALGCRLAYDCIEGFDEYGDTVSDFYHANKLHKKLRDSYQGGPIVVGSARFHQGNGAEGLEPYPGGKIPYAEAACEGPPVEVSLSLANWLEKHDKGGPQNITITTPAEMIAEDAGEEIVKQLLEIASGMGFNYVNKTGDVTRLTATGIEFENGQVLDAEIKILFPDWRAHDFLRDLPITDNEGFVVTDLYMRNPKYPQVFAAGDCAAATVPKLGSIGHQQCEIVGRQIARDMGLLAAHDADKLLQPVVLCIGDMGSSKAFYIRSNSWYGGDTQILEMGRVPHMLKMQYKQLFFATGGKVPNWGVNAAEFFAEKVAV
ncbi:MAG: FAD-dependent oxidoreductase [Gammaproteobacteria bacterium]|nr:FAD-dependent oxidoreductase [Gammaproteobacteria bacterium]MBU1723538.1 FAD-dependent oxidoreductase [Gammaproteobacteria bacterium]MBU2004096.1 FAD-dependent oxidoreductase [Gammaproteobacteria bacterium]